MGRIGCKILEYTELSSTNDAARSLMGQGAEEGTVVIAERQNAGRGRRGHKWLSPPGSSLLLSVILRPEGRIGAFEITAIAALAIVEAVEEQTGIRASIKWPNDVLIAGRKLSGILVEGVFQAGSLQDCVLGIGINVSTAAEELPDEIADTATSLRIEAGRELDRRGLLDSLLRRLEVLYRETMSGGFDSIFAKWKGRLLWLGEPVRLLDERGEFRGVVLDVERDGSLLVRGEDGIARRFMSGELSLRPDDAPAK